MFGNDLLTTSKFDLNQLIPLNQQRKLESLKRGTSSYLVTYSIILKNLVLKDLKMEKEHRVKILVFHSRTPIS